MDDNDDCKTLKTTLKSIVKNEGIIQDINKMVLILNELKFHICNFTKLYLLYCFENNLSFPVIDREFLQSVVNALNNKNTKNEKVSVFYNNHYKELISENINSSGYSYSVRYMITEIITSFENNISMRFFDYVKKYLYCLFNFKEYSSMIYKLEKNKVIRKKLIKLKISKINKTFKSLIEQKNEFGLLYLLFPDKEIKESFYYDIQCEPQAYFKNMIFMNKFLEYSEYKFFNVFPLKTSIVPSHIRIDTEQAFASLIKDKNIRKELKEFGNLSNYKMMAWEEIFNMDKKIFKSNKYMFNGSIQTDGFAVSIFMVKNTYKRNRKKKKPPKELYIDDLTRRELRNLRNKNIISIDPNKDDLIYCLSGEIGNGDLKTFRYTNNQRSKETGKRKNRKILQNEKKLKEYINEERLSRLCAKTNDTDRFKHYIKNKTEINELLKVFYERILWRKLRMSVYIKKKQSEQKMIKKFKEKFGNEESNIIAFGDWSQKEQMKYKEPTKGKSFRTLFKKAGFEVFLIDEYRTSKRCCNCKDESICETFLKIKSPRPYAVDKNGKRKEIICHGLVKCQTCNTMFNRDVNSCVNIREIAKSYINNYNRPSYLSRTTTQ